MNLETISTFLASKPEGSFVTEGTYLLLTIVLLGSYLLRCKIGCEVKDLTSKILIQYANREPTVQSYQTLRRYRRYLKLADLVINACLMGIALGLLLLIALHP